MTRRIVVGLVPVLLAVHNAEEAIAFRRMWPRLGIRLPESIASVQARLSVPAMLQALVVLSLLGCLLAAVVLLRPQWRGGWWLLLALESAMGINVLAHVGSALFVFRGYAPGLITALVLNAPFAAYCLSRARRERWVSERAWRATLVAGAVLHGPVLLGALWIAGAQG
jgi:hypothetical protein